MIDENEDIGSIVKCIMEDGFESGLAESFYDKDRFMSYLDEKYDNQYNKITNNGADYQTRTDDRSLTRRVLYQLS